MKNKIWKLAGIFCLLLTAAATSITEETAEASFENEGLVKVEVSQSTNPVDPENPEDSVNPGEGPSSKGTLRIDYASSLNFGNAQIAENDRVYTALAQQFFGDTGPRGSYIQITDQRTIST